MIQPSTRPVLAFATLALLLAGCAGQNKRTSLLLPRAVEQRDDLEPVRPTPALVADPALDAQIAAADGRLAKLASGFDTAAAATATRVAAAGNAAPGDDAWLTAQQSFGDLDTAQADTVALAADVDRMALDRAGTGLPDYPALADLRTRVEAEVSRQAQRSAALQARLKAG